MGRSPQQTSSRSTRKAAPIESRVPVRTTVHDQLVDLLRQGIENGCWTGEMSSEAELCREFQVSRMTLRKALAQLALEGSIELGGRGRLHRIGRGPRKRADAEARTIRVLTPFAGGAWSSTHSELIKVLTERVATAGLRVDIEHHPGLFERFQASKLAHLNGLPDTAAWVLFYATERLQRWFATIDRPTVLAGRASEGIPLSSIYANVEAAARHAAGLLYSRGHRNMIYLIASLTSLNDRITSEVFVAEARRLGARARIVRYKAGSEPLAKAMSPLIASRLRPTAYVAGASDGAITALCCLQAAGIRVPGEASLIAMWDDYHLDLTHPTIARYRIDPGLYGRKIAEVLLGCIRSRGGRLQSVPIIPEYVDRDSVRRLAPEPAVPKEHSGKL